MEINKPTNRGKTMKKILGTVAILAALSTLAGCQTTDAYNGESKVSSTAKWGGLSALGGAAIGGIAGGTKGALIGAAVGGAAGTGYGYYQDKQESALREKLASTGVQVKREGDKIYLIMPGNISFATAQSDIKSGFYPVLNDVALVLKEYSKSNIQVIGHTDNTGKAEDNYKLSSERAQNVASYLVNQGIASSRLFSKGEGSNSPVASNDTDQGRAANRRVEIIINQ